MKTKNNVLNAINKEIEIQKNYLSNEIISSIYFGGGTPSILSALELQNILTAIEKQYPLAKDIEITLECNPDDLDHTKLVAFKKIGINRLSIGIQSFREQDLKLMNRAHNAQEALTAVTQAKKAGFSNITIDLIYGIPGLTIEAWEDNLNHALALEVSHISAYCLTIEQGTAFGHFVAKGKLQPVDDELASQHYDTMISRLKKAGFQHYEISNFAQPGFVSRHNAAYWQNKKYLGIGPSAHSFDGVSRQWNVSNNIKYVKAIEQGLTFFEKENLSQKTRYNEYILTGLRTHWGIHLKFIQTAFGIDLLTKYDKLISQLLTNNEAILEEEIFVLTETGMLKADGISAEFFLI